MCSSQKQQEQPRLQTCLNNSFQLFADILLSKYENLTSKIVEKNPSRAKTKIFRKGRQSDDERASSEPSSDSESELEEQVRQRKKKQKININSSGAKTEKRKECQKGSRGESEPGYDRVSLHAEDGNELAGNLNNILGTDKESEDKDSDSSLKSLIQEVDKDVEIRKKVKKDLADIANKVWQSPIAFEKFKTKMKTFKKP